MQFRLKDPLTIIESQRSQRQYNQLVYESWKNHRFAANNSNIKNINNKTSTLKLCIKTV